MRVTRILVSAVFAFIVLCIAVVWWARRKEDPEVLLGWLAKGKGNKQEVLMRLNVARGDVAAAMMKAFEDQRSKPVFKAEILELLFKRYRRTPDGKLEDFLKKTIADPDPTIHAKAIECVVVYASETMQVLLTDYLDDNDIANQSKIFGLFAVNDVLWTMLSPEQHARVLAIARKRMANGSDSTIQKLAHELVGREIVDRCNMAIKAYQTADFTGGDSIIASASMLDSTNPRAQMIMARYYLANGNREKGLSIARTAGALIEIPRLSKQPIIDGDPTDDVWQHAWKQDHFFSNESQWGVFPARGRSVCQLGYYNGKIYISVTYYEKDLDKLQMVAKERDGMVYVDDNVEINLDPGCGGKNCYKIAVNPIGTVYDADLVDKSKDFQFESGTQIFKDRGYWAAELAIDPKNLGQRAIMPGIVWSLNIFRRSRGNGLEDACLWPAYRETHNIVHLFPLALFR